MKNRYLLLAGWSSVIAAILHIAVIIGGPDWYRTFGAGEQMALMAEQGDIYPTIVTLFIASILFTWGLYAFSAGGYLFRLPLLRLCLVLITAVYCIRGSYGFFLPFVSNNEHVQSLGLTFWFLSSSICLVIGMFYLIGVKQAWQYLTNPSK